MIHIPRSRADESDRFLSDSDTVLYTNKGCYNYTITLERASRTVKDAAAGPTVGLGATILNATFGVRSLLR